MFDLKLMIKFLGKRQRRRRTLPTTFISHLQPLKLKNSHLLRLRPPTSQTTFTLPLPQRKLTTFISLRPLQLQQVQVESKGRLIANDQIGFHYPD